ncbi:hypothetical protein BpHYR1_046809 [Brachionus plicatilis]|uniref:Uncharacterized protein n=1 Tax=Brachionus plicatilis TaxID=10195 RepID=A0A3M7RNA5_BRAPC|nr:hypothetical protein BpHYR1_046809 [Brachionus plicatilis]
MQEIELEYDQNKRYLNGQLDTWKSELRLKNSEIDLLRLEADNLNSKNIDSQKAEFMIEKRDLADVQKDFTRQFRIKIRENFPQNPNETIGFYRSADNRKFLGIKFLGILTFCIIEHFARYVPHDRTFEKAFEKFLRNFTTLKLKFYEIIRIIRLILSHHRFRSGLPFYKLSQVLSQLFSFTSLLACKFIASNSEIIFSFELQYCYEKLFLRDFTKFCTSFKKI